MTNHPHRSKRHLFDCSPAMAAKLARCNEIAKAQRSRWPITPTAEDVRAMLYTDRGRALRQGVKPMKIAVEVFLAGGFSSAWIALLVTGVKLCWEDPWFAIVVGPAMLLNTGMLLMLADVAL